MLQFIQPMDCAEDGKNGSTGQSGLGQKSDVDKLESVAYAQGHLAHVLAPLTCLPALHKA